MTEAQASNVRDFNPALTLSQFFDNMYKEQMGFIYLATKSVATEAWVKKFFRWPAEKEQAVEYVLRKTPDHEVYYSPALFSADRSAKDDPIQRSDFMGSYFIWADYDGRLPSEDDLKGIPAPTVKIRSSEGKNQHWYWELKFFETDPDVLESLSKRVAYATQADMSGWDFVQVLRPPATIHHDTGRSTKLLQSNDQTYSIDTFTGIPSPPVGAWDIVLEEVEKDATHLLHLYSIPSGSIDLFRKKSVPVGKRSDCLMAAAYVCAEVGMTNGQIFKIVKHLDDRWQKWAPRGEKHQEKCILGTIRKARIKHPEGTLSLEDIDEEIPWMTLGEFRKKELVVEWIIPGFLQKKGIFFISSDSGVGKTHFSMLVACHMALGKPFLDFEFQNPMRLAIIQMEIPEAEFQEEFNKILDSYFSEEEIQIIEGNIDVIPKGSMISLKSPRIREMLIRRLDRHKPEGIFWDSFQIAVGGDMIGAENLNEIFDFVKREIGNQRDCFNWFIHHNRKDETTRTARKQPKGMDDLYGGQAISAVATTVMGLWKESPGEAEIHVSCLKSRYAKGFQRFVIRRPEGGVGFEKVTAVGERMYVSEKNVTKSEISIEF